MKRKIKILFTYANTEELGGADFCLLKLASALDPNIFKVFVIFSRETDLEEKFLETNIQVEYINIPRLQKSNNPLRYLTYLFSGIVSIFKLVKFIKENQIDIQHANDLLDIFGPLASKIAGIRSVQHVRMILPDGSMKKVLTWLAMSLNDYVINVSKGTANQMFPGWKSLPKVIIGYDWIDPNTTGHKNYLRPFREEIKVSKDTLLIGIVGRLQHWKGQHLFLSASKIIFEKYPESQFVVCGSEVHGRHRSYKEKLLALVAGSKIENSVIFTGYRSDVMNIISSLDILVHASIEPDPLPGVVMEAGLAGVPIVAANSGGVAEEVVNGVTGFLYETGDLTDLVSKITELIDLGPEQRKLMGEQGREFIENKFSQEKILVQFQKIYLNLMGLD